MLSIPIDYLLRRMLGRATCVKHPSARLGFRSRVLNISGDSRHIEIGAHTIVNGELMTFGHGGRVRLGEWCYVGEGTRIWSAADISIGNRVLISHNVNIFDSLTHPLDLHARHQHFRSISTSGHPRQLDLDEKPVVIEDDAWISAGSFVLRGTTIGRGAVVAAAAVVTGDVAPFTVVAGNPARVVRTLDQPGGETA